MLTAVKYLKIFVEFEEYIQALDDGEKGRLFAAMLAYARDGQEPELPGNERFLWPVARQQLKNAAAQYQKVCAANSANARRRAAGVTPYATLAKGDSDCLEPQADGAGVPPQSRPARPLQGLGQSEESQQVPGDLASEAAEAVALEDRSARLGGLEPLGGRAICALPLGDGVDYPIFDWKAAEWARQFPGADVPAQLAKMRAWLLAHPERRKRKQEIIPFVLRWLEKAQKAQRPPVCPAAPAASMAGAEPPSFNLEAIRQLMLENSGAY